jgi:hypothetical protein
MTVTERKLKNQRRTVDHRWSYCYGNGREIKSLLYKFSIFSKCEDGFGHRRIYCNYLNNVTRMRQTGHEACVGEN